MWTQIRLLLQEQSDLGLHCVTKRLQKHLGRLQKQVTLVVIMENLENHKKVPCMEKSCNLKKTLNNHGQIMEFCEII